MNTNIINYCNNTETIYGILDIFKESFLNEFKALKSKERPPVIKALPYLYRMWYYSTLITDTALSPANFINTQVRKNLDDNSIVVPTATPIYKNKVLKDFKFEYTIFTLDNHPVLKDLKLFLEQCTPDIGIDKDGVILEDEKNSFIGSLSFKEIFYVTFLTNTAYELNLLKKMPSINTYRAMPVHENIDTFFNLSNMEQLQKIYDATLTLASKALCSTFTFDKKTFSKESLINLFKNAMDLEDFLYNTFKKFNIKIDLDLDDLDFESISSLEDLNIPEETVMGLALKLNLTFIIDAYLLTPIGYYLQLIQPIYINTIDFEILFTQLIEAENLNIPLIRFYFMMSNGYDLTTLGKKLLLEGKSPKNKYQKLDGKIDFKKEYADIVDFNSIYMEPDFEDDEFSFAKEFLDALEKMDSDAKVLKKQPAISPIPYNDKEAVTDKNKAYALKVKHYYNKRSWKTLLIKGTQSLDELASAIISEFDLDCGHMYSFFMNNKPFDENYEITCPYFIDNKYKSLTTKYKIYDLNLYQKQKFLFIYDFGDDIRFEIEFIDAYPLEKSIKYPIIKNTSKDYKL